MISSKDSLRLLLQNLQKDKRFELNKHEVDLPQSKIIFIDIVPKSKEQAQLNSKMGKVEHSTIMITRSTHAGNIKDENIEWVIRSSTIQKQLFLSNIQSSNSKNRFGESLYQSQGLKNVLEALRKNRRVEIIKSGWPHGLTIQLSYLPQVKRWIVSDGSRTCLVQQMGSIAESPDNQLSVLAKCLADILKNTKINESLKMKLKTMTIIGKVIKNYKQIVFYTAVCNKTGIDIDPFQAREKVEQLGLKYVSIKSLGIFNSQKDLQNSIFKTMQSIRCDFRQSIGHLNGRAKLFFVLNDGSCLGGLNISTSEDLLYKEMRSRIVNTQNSVDKLKHLDKMLLQMKEQLPYPIISYQKLFQSLNKLVQILGLSKQQFSKRWFQLPKLCLYMLSKKISLQKYAKRCFENTILDQINQIPLEEFGPIQAKIILIYYLVHPSQYLRQRIAEKLKSSFEDINVNLLMLDSKANKADQIKEVILLPKDSQHNYFIIQTLDINKLKRLQSDLNKSSINTYYKLITLSESCKQETIIDEDFYPFSWTSLVDHYLSTLNSVKKSSSQQKIRQLKRATESIKAFRNENIVNVKNRIPINLGQLNESKQVKQLIGDIFINGSWSTYKRFLEYLQKTSSNKFNLDVTNVLKQSYSSIRTICIKSQ